MNGNLALEYDSKIKRWRQMKTEPIYHNFKWNVLTHDNALIVNVWVFGKRCWCISDIVYRILIFSFKSKRIFVESLSKQNVHKIKMIEMKDDVIFVLRNGMRLWGRWMWMSVLQMDEMTKQCFVIFKLKFFFVLFLF